jgi:hypothetical protein
MMDDFVPRDSSSCASLLAQEPQASVPIAAQTRSARKPDSTTQSRADGSRRASTQKGLAGDRSDVDQAFRGQRPSRKSAGGDHRKI